MEVDPPALGPEDLELHQRDEEDDEEVHVPELSVETSAQVAERLLKVLSSGVCAREYTRLQAIRPSRSTSCGRLVV